MLEWQLCAMVCSIQIIKYTILCPGPCCFIPPVQESPSAKMVQDTIRDQGPNQKIQGQGLFMKQAVCEPIPHAVELLNFSRKQARPTYKLRITTHHHPTAMLSNASMNKAPLSSSIFANSHVSATASCLAIHQLAGNYGGRCQRSHHS